MALAIPYGIAGLVMCQDEASGWFGVLQKRRINYLIKSGFGAGIGAFSSKFPRKNVKICCFFQKLWYNITV
jgi:hypothetical protein